MSSHCITQATQQAMQMMENFNIRRATASSLLHYLHLTLIKTINLCLGFGDNVVAIWSTCFSVYAKHSK